MVNMASALYVAHRYEEALLSYERALEVGWGGVGEIGRILL